MKRNAIYALLASCGLAGSGLVQADTFSLWQGGTGGSFLTQNTTYTNSFDGNLLFNPGLDAISNAIVTLNFVGSANSQFLGSTSQVTASGTYDNTLTTTALWQTTDTTYHYSDPLDSVNVLLGKKGGQTASGSDLVGAYGSSQVASTSPVNITTKVTQQNTYSYSCGWFSTCYGTNYYDILVGSIAGYDRTINATTGYKGSFAVVANLDNASLNQFESTGLFRYGFTVIGGGVALESATLSFTTTPITISVVPEPEAYSMTLAGLGLLAMVYRRRRNIKA